jgi:hypothetical protein
MPMDDSWTTISIPIEVKKRLTMYMHNYELRSLGAAITKLIDDVDAKSIKSIDKDTKSMSIGKSMKSIDINMKDTKTCSKCGVEKDIGEYSSDRTRSDRLHHQCKACMSSYRKAHRKALREKKSASTSE